MNNEINEMLKGKWHVVDNKGTVFKCDSELSAMTTAHDYNAGCPDDAPHYVAQLQVAGTLPEGAIMPKYKVGDRVITFGDSENNYLIASIEPVYRIKCEKDMREIAGVFSDVNIQLAPPADPMRDEFELAWFAGNWHNIGVTKDNAYRIWQAAKAGAK